MKAKCTLPTGEKIQQYLILQNLFIKSIKQNIVINFRAASKGIFRFDTTYITYYIFTYFPNILITVVGSRFIQFLISQYCSRPNNTGTTIKLTKLFSAWSSCSMHNVLLLLLDNYYNLITIIIILYCIQ